MAFITSANTGTSSATIADTRWWLKDIQIPANNVSFDVYGDSFDTEVDEEQARYKPLGRKFPVIITDAIHGEDGVIHAEFLDSTYQAFVNLRNLQKTVLLQSGWLNKTWYVRLGKTLKIERFNTSPPVTRCEIEYVEVDTP